MEPQSHLFKQNAKKALNDANLARALTNMKAGFQEKRRKTIDKLPEFQDLRTQGRDVKNHALDNLDFYLTRFEQRVTEQGGHVHWARTPAEAREAILEICRSVDAKSVTKGKSMVSEEIGLNDFLIEAGLQPIETDLGEYIIQLRHELPSHIIAPAIHLNREDVAKTFRENHTGLDPNRRLDQVQDFTDEARAILRRKFQFCRCRHHRCKLHDCGNRLDGDCHQRGQRRPDPAAA